ncbi:hypothetical protein GCM10009678_54420 [Actinomadura kijaniata]
MSNLPDPIPPTRVPEARKRLDLLLDLLTGLYELGRGATVRTDDAGQSVLMVRAVRSGRSVGVVVWQEPRRGWAYVWDGHSVPADGTARAAHLLAAVSE